MPLIACPECSKQISDKATSCPHCGNPLRIAAPIKPPEPKGEGCFLQTMNAGCAIMFAIMVLIIIGGILSSHR